jgi:hypothetical protein
MLRLLVDTAMDVQSLSLSELEAQGYSRLTWICAACKWPCSQGLRLMRLRRQATPTSTIVTVSRILRCPKCSHHPDASQVSPTCS